MTTALAPKRVLRELSPEDLLSRTIDRAREIRDAAIARANADYVQRVIDAVEAHKAEPPSSSENGTHSSESSPPQPPAVS